MGEFSIGQSVLRREDPRLLKGLGRYHDDFNLADQFHAAIVRSPHAHADILGLDAAAALAMPGVHAVLTGENYRADGLGSLPSMAPYKKRDGSAMYLPPRPAIAIDRVMHVGYPVAVVVAATLDLARDGAERIAVEYAPQPAVVSAEAAFHNDAPQLYGDCPNNEAYFLPHKAEGVIHHARKMDHVNNRAICDTASNPQGHRTGSRHIVRDRPPAPVHLHPPPAGRDGPAVYSSRICGTTSDSEEVFLVATPTAAVPLKPLEIIPRSVRLGASRLMLAIAAAVTEMSRVAGFVTRGLIRIRKLLAAAIDSAMYASIKRECVSSIPANEKSHAPSTDRLRGDRDGPPG